MECHCKRSSWIGVIVVLVACGGASEPGGGNGGPTTGDLAVTAASTGFSLDPDGYDLALDGGTPTPIQINGTNTFSDLGPGSHTVLLGGVASNCTLSGQATRTATVVAGQTASIIYNLTCTRVIHDQIVFQQGAGPTFGITLMNPNGSAVTPLLNDGYQNEAPVVSPDGTLIAFISTKPGTLGLYVMSSHGTGIRRLAPTVLNAGDPAWSPDGLRIAFQASRQDTMGINPEIAVIDVDGTGFAYLTNNFEFDGSPTWSPDGASIAYVSQDGTDGIYVMNSSDGTNRTLVPNTSPTDGYPQWSPDGTRFAFQSARDGGWEIYTIQVDGNDVRRLTTNAATDFTPSWSPDGLQIVFSSDRSGTMQVWTMEAATGATPLGPFGGLGQRPNWAR